MDERRGQRGGAGYIVALVTLALGAMLGIGLTLGVLGVGLDVLLGRVFNPGAAPVVQVGPTATPRPQAIAGAAPGRRFLPREPIALDTDTSTPDLLVISRNYDRNTSTIAYMSADSGAIRWESASLSDENDEYAWGVAYSDGQVIAAVQTRLVGLSRATGEQIWEAPLTDAVSTICRDCVRVFGDVVVVLSDDGELQAFAAASGAPRWKVRLRAAPRQLVAVRGLVGVPDERDDGEGGAVLRLFSPADGAEAEPFAPACQSRGSDYGSNASIYDEIERDPRGRFLVWLIGSSPSCLLSLDTATGEVAGRTYLDGFSGADLDPQRRHWDGDTLYLSDNSQIVAVGPQEARTLVTSEDYYLAPVAAGDGVLVVQAQRSRGSSRYELWAVDAASGQRLWDRVLVASDPFEGPRETGSFATIVAGDALALVEAHEEPEELRYELIGLRDGLSRGRSALGVEDPTDDLRGAVLGNDRLMLVTDELYTVDLATGQVRARWP